MKLKKFRALQVSEEDGSFVRRVVTRDLAQLPDHEVLVRVCFSSLNYKDALSASGNRGVTRRYPHTPGIDAAGVVEESRSSEFKPGDEVVVSCYDLGMNTPGGLAEYIRVPAEWVMPRPSGLSLRQCMMYGTAGFTAAQCVARLVDFPVRPEDGKILVTGATGGVGILALAMLAGLGYRVCAVTGKAEQEELLTRLGAEQVLGRAEAVDESGRMLLKGRWAGVVDTVGGPILATAVKSCRYDGLVTCCGNAASPDLPLNVYPFILRGVTLAGIDSAQCPMPRRRLLWQRLADLWQIKDLEALVTEIALEEVDEKITTILAGRHLGRVVVKMVC
ncbi:YhdH/YhfP family quinone oxidoreductase [Desulfurivibrio alkaliphilus]|uniref:Quinone oxidoreductase, YhdH/YhfP family n=1 Tax=Desulfurivibrio alkaliphilus (strain DSM 19089 / UNIQEM U267 / AHT2) TaxID=589865 RepID=D6Z5K7_DESAT|nr:YhdH/YhfP family quinone oxidoreductase [Desulfurivibrio alkaliphilus]ADH86744.1 quinone oxidoreductase, YhdH/YhfP family [Desulfurivibrio alkaliphilus AHT 2]